MELLVWLLGSKLFWVIVLSLGTYFVGIPLLTYSAFRNEANPTIDTFNPRDKTLPPRVHEHFRVTCDELMPLGFEYVAGMFLPQTTTDAMAILILLVNRHTQDSVIGVSLFAKEEGNWALRTNYVEYSTKFQDGTDVNTMNSTELSAFKTAPNTFNYRFPMIRSSAALYELHMRLAQRHGGSYSKVLRLDRDFHGDAVAFIRAALCEEMAAAAKDGYLYLSKEEQVYRATLQGAFIMTWRELWPFKWLRQRNRDSVARRQLDELGYNSKSATKMGAA